MLYFEASCVAMWLSLWWLSYAFIVLNVKCLLCAPVEGFFVSWEFMLRLVVEGSDRLFMFAGTLHSIVGCDAIFPSTTWQNTLDNFVYYISSEVHFLGNATFLFKQNHRILTQECCTICPEKFVIMHVGSLFCREIYMNVWLLRNTRIIQTSTISLFLFVFIYFWSLQKIVLNIDSNVHMEWQVTTLTGSFILINNAVVLIIHLPSFCSPQFLISVHFWSLLWPFIFKDHTSQLVRKMKNLLPTNLLTPSPVLTSQYKI